MSNLLKIIQDRFKVAGKNFPFEFRIEETKPNDFSFIVMVDCSRVDINSPNYDADYDNLFKKKRKEAFWFMESYNYYSDYVLKNVVGLYEALQPANFKISPAYEFKNYEYMDSFEPLIEEAIKHTSYPDVKFEFEGRYDNPRIAIRFIFTPYVLKEKFLEELEINLSGVLDINAYNIWTQGGWRGD